MILVRNYTDSDFESVKALYQNTETFGGQFDEDRDSAKRMSGANILVAEAEGKIVGTVSLLYDKRFAWLMRFAVAAEHEAEASQLLFDKASEILKAAGHTQVLVYAPEGTKFAERYQSLGFTKGQQPYDSYWRSF